MKKKNIKRSVNSFRVQRYIPIFILILVPIFFILDILFIPFVILSAILFYIIRWVDINHLEMMPITKKILRIIGVYPVINHFYDPMFHPKQLMRPLSDDRSLPGIDLNVGLQLKILSLFHYAHEFAKIPLYARREPHYFYLNHSFLPVDAQYFYNVIRWFKPGKIIEIGSGFSTLIAVEALEENKKENSSYMFEHTCIEPYRNPWLETLNIKLIKKRVEEVGKEIFLELEANDILFIDSSHVIKPQGDVLVEYLEILPVLKPGVLVHIHDIYTPRDYPYKCLVKQMKFWNEQYLLEAFLSDNHRYEIIGAVNYLKSHYFSELASKCPVLTDERIAKKSKKKMWGTTLHFLETSSFWIRKK